MFDRRALFEWTPSISSPSAQCTAHKDVFLRSHMTNCGVRRKRGRLSQNGRHRVGRAMRAVAPPGRPRTGVRFSRGHLAGESAVPSAHRWMLIQMPVIKPTQCASPQCCIHIPEDAKCRRFVAMLFNAPATMHDHWEKTSAKHAIEVYESPGNYFALNWDGRLNV